MPSTNASGTPERALYRSSSPPPPPPPSSSSSSLPPPLPSAVRCAARARALVVFVVVAAAASFRSTRRAYGRGGPCLRGVTGGNLLACRTAARIFLSTRAPDDDAQSRHASRVKTTRADTRRASRLQPSSSTVAVAAASPREYGGGRLVNVDHTCRRTQHLQPSPPSLSLQSARTAAARQALQQRATTAAIGGGDGAAA